MADSTRVGKHLIVMSLLASALYAALPTTRPSEAGDLDRIWSGSFASGGRQGHDSSALVLVSWNIERGTRQSEILQAFRGPLAADLCLLQEVDLYTRRAGRRNVAEDFARELGMNYVFGVEFEELAQGRPGSPAFHGQAVLSSFPITRTRVVRFRHQLHNWRHAWLPRWAWIQPRNGGRMALVTEIDLGRQSLVLYDTHLESKASDAGRAEQIQEILEDLRTHYPADAPVVIAGDLNTKKGANSPVLDYLRAAGFRDVLDGEKGPLRTKSGSRRRADWILARNLRFFDARILELAISDHFPLRVRIAPPESPEVQTTKGTQPVHP